MIWFINCRSPNFKSFQQVFFAIRCHDELIAQPTSMTTESTVKEINMKNAEFYCKKWKEKEKQRQKMSYSYDILQSWAPVNFHLSLFLVPNSFSRLEIIILLVGQSRPVHLSIFLCFLFLIHFLVLELLPFWLVNHVYKLLFKDHVCNI